MNTKEILLIAILLLTIPLFGQDINSSSHQSQNSLNGNGNNELRLNLLMSIAGLPELSYERFIADNMGIGLSAAISLDKFENESMRSIILPYYRLYFGNKKANGFFIEGNMAMIGIKEYDYISSYQSLPVTTKYTTNFGFGAAVGAKFLTRNNFLGEAYLGVGRLFGESSVGAYPRVGISLGKRF